MRPIQITPDLQYNEANLLTQTISSASVESQRKRARSQSLGELLEALNTLFSNHWRIPEQRWDSDAIRLRASRLYEKILKFYENNAQPQIKAALAGQLGEYCVYCDTPVPSGIDVVHRLPSDRYPEWMFKFDNHYPTCLVCQHFLYNGIQRSQADPSALENDYAWPHRYWQVNPNLGRLPYQYTLMRFSPNPSGQYHFGTVVPESEYLTLLAAYRAGSIYLSDGQIVWENGLDDSRKVLILKINSSAFLDPISKLLVLVNINNTKQVNLSIGIDRRAAQRTQLFFTALSMRETYDSIAQLQLDDPLRSVLMNGLTLALKDAVQASGQWGVWLTLFRDIPGFQSDLNRWLSGTAATTWIL